VWQNGNIGAIRCCSLAALPFFVLLFETGIVGIRFWACSATNKQRDILRLDLVATQNSDGSENLDGQLVVESEWDCEASPLTIGVQANMRHASDKIRVDFRGTVGAREGSAVGANHDENSASRDIPNASLKANNEDVSDPVRAWPAVQTLKMPPSHYSG